MGEIRMGLLVGNPRPLTVGGLERWVRQSDVKTFHPDRRYFEELRAKPYDAALLTALQLMYMMTMPKNRRSTPERVFARPEYYSRFAGIFEATTRVALLGFFTSGAALADGLKPALTSVDFVSQFKWTKVNDELKISIAIHEVGDTIFLRLGELGQARSSQWRSALFNVSAAVDSYFTFPGRPIKRLPRTEEYLSQALPLLFSGESAERLKQYLSIKN